MPPANKFDYPPGWLNPAEEKYRKPNGSLGFGDGGSMDTSTWPNWELSRIPTYYLAALLRVNRSNVLAPHHNNGDRAAAHFLELMRSP